MGSSEIQRHYRSLGVKNKSEYYSWCIEAGFPASGNKSARKLSLEQAFARDHTQRKMLNRNKEVPFKKFIGSLRGGSEPKSFNSKAHQIIYRVFATLIKRGKRQEPSENDREKASLFLDVLLHLDTCSKLSSEEDAIKTIGFLVAHSDRWIKPYKHWKSKSHNRHKQLSSFIRHLLAKYKVPAFMDYAWEAEYRGRAESIPKTHAQEWFIHMGAGKNIRTAKNLPCKLTKKEAHHFLNAPDHYNIYEAFRWGQIHALGGSTRIASALRETKLMSDFAHNDFCLQVVKFFIDHPMLDRVHVQPIIDYIWNQKFENRTAYEGRGVARNMGPVQPNFSMNGRTGDTLLQQVDRWHRQLGKESKGRQLEWQHSAIKDFRIIKGNKENRKHWGIMQLVNHRELSMEGRAMKHCVASYAHSCAKGACSIWSLSLNDIRQITIEVSREYQIQQLRGRLNRLPTAAEMAVIKTWATKEGISFANYLGV